MRVLQQKIVGEFIIDRIISDNPSKIYQKYNKYLGIDKENCFKYFNNRNIGYTIKIKKIIKYQKEYHSIIGVKIFKN